MRQMTRNPFARTTFVRERVRPLRSHESCAFCGGVRTTPRRATPFLYRYGTEPDAIRSRVAWHGGAFCSKRCHDAYHDAA
jgi:hypothetical protein